MRIWNTLTKTKEEFKPLKEGFVGMYSCGFTVYDYSHIGNLRKYTFDDILRRTLEFKGYEVNQIMNVTDVGHLVSDADEGEDKVEKGARREHKTVKEITEKFASAFFEDLHEMNIKASDDKDIESKTPWASRHIPEQIELIKKIEAKGFTYKTSDGIYFDTAKFPEYGKLGSINLSGLEEGARVGINKEKRNPTDFAVWKFSKPEEKREQEWDSPWGIGFPGWHIECSAMSMKYLGETFDIHTGGIDHIPVHHNNEIAQSEAATGKKFVNYWVHEDFLNINSTKVSKSLGNTFRLKDLKEKSLHPLSYRYWLLTAHYKTQVDFTFEAVLGAQNAFENILRTLASTQNDGSVQKDYLEEFKSLIEDDLDTPRALALLHKLLADANVLPQDKKATALKFDEVLGLNLEELSKKIIDIPSEIQKLGEERDKMRIEKKWPESDELRKQIESQGYILQDSKDKTIIERKLTPDL